MNVFPNSIKMKTHSFLADGGIYSTANIINGTDDMYNPPKTSNCMPNDLIFLSLVCTMVLIQPTKNIMIVMHLKKTSKYAGMVSYM